MNTILRRDMIAPNFHLLEVEAPEIARKIVAGQFFIVRADEYSERIPLNPVSWDREKGSVGTVFMQAGRSTNKLARLKAGDTLPTCVGPLGKKLEMRRFGTAACIGGCYGIGGIAPVACALKEAGNRVLSFIEARSSFLLYGEDALAWASDELIISTKDGSKGHKGNNAGTLDAMLKSGCRIDHVIAIGCTFMMYAVSNITKASGIPTRVILNPIMVDGTGMCGACRVEVGGVTRFACVDGPDFDGHQVSWDLLLSRRKAYCREETFSEEIMRHG